MFLNILLLGLLVAWMLLLFGGFALGKPQTPTGRRMPTWTRMLSSLALVLAGWGWYLMAKDTSVGAYAGLIGIGMTFGFIGDLFMAKLLRFIPLKEPVMGGIAAFGFGHIAYIVGMLLLADKLAITSPAPRLIAWLIWLVIGAALWYIIVFRPAKSRSGLHYAALGYALLLSSTAGVATGLALGQSTLVPLALGAALFLSSDLILAGQLFSGLKFPLIDDVIWLTYGPGQMLIVFSINVALLVAK